MIVSNDGFHLPLKAKLNTLMNRGVRERNQLPITQNEFPENFNLNLKFFKTFMYQKNSDNLDENSYFFIFIN